MNIKSFITCLSFIITLYAINNTAIANQFDPVLSDEFNNNTIDLLNNNTSSWQVLHADRTQSADIGITAVGKLVVLADPSFNQAWFENQYGPLIYKNVSGNFAVMTLARVVSSDDPSRAPAGSFNAGGFVIRDPSGTHQGNERWVMHNFGSQGPGGYARELKKTLPALPGSSSSRSNLFLTPQFNLEEHLMVCRLGDEFRFYTWDEDNERWLEEQYYNNYPLANDMQNPLGVNFSQINTSIGNGTALISQEEIDTSINPGERTTMRFDMSGIANTVQVGIMGHVWSGQDQHNTRAEFDYVRFSASPPQTAADCVNAFNMTNNPHEPTQIPLPWLALVITGILLSTIGLRRMR